MRLYLINPSNPLVSIAKVKESRWNRFRVWKTTQPYGSRGPDPAGVGNYNRGREPRGTGLFGHASTRPAGQALIKEQSPA